ncbi:hypothetical protein TWF173_009406 [Orbilia oligospora]|nr:hypothetical protein TWF173_009406 [Orbilia oligospora]
MPDGTDFDGKQLLTLVLDGKSPFQGVWDVKLLIQEAEENLNAQVIDIPEVYKGSNNYGFHLKLSNGREIMARLARSDVNTPDYLGFPMDMQVADVKFEAAAYELLRSEPDILASRLLYHRVAMQHNGPKLDPPQDISGRRLLLFEKAEGENNIFNLSAAQQVCLPFANLFFWIQLSCANLLSRNAFLPRQHVSKPKSLPVPVALTREFCVALFTSKIEATIKNIGDMIGWECDNNTVGPVAATAKISLLRLIPHIIPAGDNEEDTSHLYRLVLEHGDFGIHNMSITMDASDQPLVTSVYDWETGCLVPAILSDPLMAVWVDLVTDENAAPSITRVSEDATLDDLEQYATWSRQYFMEPFKQAPDYERAIQAGKDARHLWFALRNWRGDDPEEYFGDLGTWADRRMTELGFDSPRVVHCD